MPSNNGHEGGATLNGGPTRACVPGSEPCDTAHEGTALAGGNKQKSPAAPGGGSAVEAQGKWQDTAENSGQPVIEAAETLPGVADGFGRLWTPHRAAYISGENRPTPNNDNACPFCAAPQKSDEDSLIIARGKSCFAILNLYPYNSGHLLICTYRHVSFYTDLTDEERVEMGEMTAQAMRVLRAAMNPAGFNMGMNQGEVGGAGIAAHIHQHVVPRWLGDANFLPIIARTKTVPAILSDTRELLAHEWEKESQNE